MCIRLVLNLAVGGIASNQMLPSSSNPFAERVQQTSVSAPGSDSEGSTHHVHRDRKYINIAHVVS